MLSLTVRGHPGEGTAQFPQFRWPVLGKLAGPACCLKLRYRRVQAVHRAQHPSGHAGGAEEEHGREGGRGHADEKPPFPQFLPGRIQVDLQDRLAQNLACAAEGAGNHLGIRFRKAEAERGWCR